MDVEHQLDEQVKGNRRSQAKSTSGCTDSSVKPVYIGFIIAKLSHSVHLQLNYSLSLVLKVVQLGVVRLANVAVLS